MGYVWKIRTDAKKRVGREACHEACQAGREAVGSCDAPPS